MPSCGNEPETSGSKKFTMILNTPVTLFVVMTIISPPHLANLEISVKSTIKVNK